MEKLEKHIKEKLEERVLTPSPKAWDSIASNLGTEVKTKRNYKYWYAIAASLIGLLIVSVLYFNVQNKNEPSIEVVKVDREPVIKEINTPNIVEVANANNEIEQQLQQGIAEDPKKTNSKTESLIQNSVEVAVFKEGEKEQNSINDGFIKPNPEDLLIDKKINEVLATVINLESEAIQVSDAEVDSLLRNAQLDILKEKIFQENGKVDAMALLTEVEDELDQSFRDKIFTKLKEGLFKARTAVADRNN